MGKVEQHTKALEDAADRLLSSEAYMVDSPQASAAAQSVLAHSAAIAHFTANPEPVEEPEVEEAKPESDSDSAEAPAPAKKPTRKKR